MNPFQFGYLLNILQEKSNGIYNRGKLFLPPPPPVLLISFPLCCFLSGSCQLSPRQTSLYVCRSLSLPQLSPLDSERTSHPPEHEQSLKRKQALRRKSNRTLKEVNENLYKSIKNSWKRIAMQKLIVEFSHIEGAISKIEPCRKGLRNIAQLVSGIWSNSSTVIQLPFQVGRGIEKSVVHVVSSLC